MNTTGKTLAVAAVVIMMAAAAVGLGYAYVATYQNTDQDADTVMAYGIITATGEADITDAAPILDTIITSNGTSKTIDYTAESTANGWSEVGSSNVFYKIEKIGTYTLTSNKAIDAGKTVKLNVTGTTADAIDNVEMYKFKAKIVTKGTSVTEESAFSGTEGSFTSTSKQNDLATINTTATALSDGKAQLEYDVYVCVYYTPNSDLSSGYSDVITSTGSTEDNKLDWKGTVELTVNLA